MKRLAISIVLCVFGTSVGVYAQSGGAAPVAPREIMETLDLPAHAVGGDCYLEYLERLQIIEWWVEGCYEAPPPVNICAPHPQCCADAKAIMEQEVMQMYLDCIGSSVYSPPATESDLLSLVAIAAFAQPVSAIAPEPPCGQRPNEPDPCEEPPSRRSCNACAQCRISACRSWHPNDAEAQAACREAAMLEYRMCLEQVWPANPPAPRRSDLNDDGKIDGTDYTIGLNNVLSGEWDQTRLFEFIDDYLKGNP